MATSSLSKSFVIKTKTEAKNFVKLFTEQDKNPPLRDVNVIPVSKERLKKFITKSIITSFSFGFDSAISSVKAVSVLLSITCLSSLYKIS